MVLITKDMIDKAREENACEEELDKAEKQIGMELTDPYWAYWYAMNVVKGQWEEAENVIFRSPRYSYLYVLNLYVLNVIKKRYKKAESIIAQSHEYAYLYAKDIIKGRWEEEEEDLVKNYKALWDIYHEEFCIKE